MGAPAEDSSALAYSKAQLKSFKIKSRPQLEMSSFSLFSFSIVTAGYASLCSSFRGEGFWKIDPHWFHMNGLKQPNKQYNVRKVTISLSSETQFLTS